MASPLSTPILLKILFLVSESNRYSNRFRDRLRGPRRRALSAVSSRPTPSSIFVSLSPDRPAREEPPDERSHGRSRDDVREKAVIVRGP